MYFQYDSEGNVVSMTFEGTRYYYVKNQQGDVEKIIDKSGNVVVTYKYDAWGNLCGMTDTSGAWGIGSMNPFRYRSYVYDDNTGLYYLRSRYYDPVTGRFLNADDVAFIGSTGTPLSSNVFAYCENNYICAIDSTGYFSQSVDSWIATASWISGNYIVYSYYNTKSTISSAAMTYLTIKNCPVTNVMLYKAMYGGKLPKEIKKERKDKIKNSEKLKARIIKMIKNQKGKINTKKEYSINFRRNEEPIDLHYAIGHANLKIIRYKVTNNKNWTFRIEISDTFDFDEFRIIKQGFNISNAANDLGYAMQFIGMVKPYDWRTEFDYSLTYQYKK